MRAPARKLLHFPCSVQFHFTDIIRTQINLLSFQVGGPGGDILAGLAGNAFGGGGGGGKKIRYLFSTTLS